MSLVTMKSLLERADAAGIAVGAFSVGNMEMVMGAVKAAEEMNTPVILQIAEKRMKNSPFELMAPMMVAAARNSKTDIAVHLDHGLTKECVRAALGAGFTSVMLDCSLKPFEQNIAETKEVVVLAAEYGATVEAELGIVGGNEGDSAEHKITCTSPDAAEVFIKETGIDALAVAIGNAHGNYPVSPELRFDVLEEIYKRVNTPLVLHGGTGIGAEQFRHAISLGIRKINIATASFDAYAKASAETGARQEKPDWFGLSTECVNAVYENVKKHIGIFGTM